MQTAKDIALNTWTLWHEYFNDAPNSLVADEIFETIERQICDLVERSKDPKSFDLKNHECTFVPLGSYWETCSVCKKTRAPKKSVDR